MTVNAPLPVETGAPIWREALDGALAELRRLPRWADRAPLVESIERAIASLHAIDAAATAEADRLDRVDRALAEIAACRVAAERRPSPGRAAVRLASRLAAVERSVREQRAATVEALVARGGDARAPAPPRPGFRASAGVPVLVTVARELVLPLGDVDPPDEADDDGDDDPALAWRPFPPPAALAPRPSRPGAPPEASQRAAALGQLRRLARGCLEEIGVLGVLRRVEPGDPRHGGIAGFERRLLESFDALAALGTPFAVRAVGDARRGRAQLDVLDEALRYGDDAVTADPARAFARAFVLCSVEGTGGPEAAVSALRRSPAATLAAQEDALALASNPHVAAAVRRLYDEDPARICLALDVTRRRRQPDAGHALIALGHADGGVRCAAARCLSASSGGRAGVSLLERALDAEIEDEPAAAVAEALLRLGAATGLRAARRRLEEAIAAGERDPEARQARLRWTRLVAVAGDPGDVDLIGRALDEDGEAFEAAGWFGSVLLIAPLLSVAERGPGHYAQRRALARAIGRITGWRPEEVGATADGPAPDPGAWRRRWDELGAGFSTTQRLRFGQPWTPLSAIDELERDHVSGADRETCALELAIATEGASLLDPADWVARQAQHAAALRAHFAGAAARAGAWPAFRPER